MKDKEKQIEEMASDMDYACTSKDLYPSDAKEIAKTLYLLNYRKIDNDSVMLSKGAYESLSSKAKANVVNAIEIRKDTAENILKLVFKHITTLEVWEVLQHNTWLSAVGNFTANKHIWDLLLEPIAQQVGVEIKE